MAFHEHGFWVRDSTLEVWLQCLVAELDRHAELAPWCQVARTAWHRQAQSGANGCLSMGLDELITTDVQAADMVHLCEAVLESLIAYGDAIPQATLNAWASPGSWWPSDLPIDQLLPVGHALIDLLQGKLTTTAATAPVL